jgi:L-threonylcarbamoyladenylate synthase
VTDGQTKRSAEILSTETSQLFRAAVARAADLLRAGELVAVPTETVYGLAANALNRQAVARIFEVKGRPANNPLIVHVSHLDMARRCAALWPPLADSLAAAFWPGPLTLVLRCAPEIPDIVTASGDTVGIRWPSHPFMQALIDTCGFPLAAPSANLSNQLSPTSASHVAKSLGDKIPLIIDGGQSQVGIESTVLDISVSPPVLLRPGMIHAESLLASMPGETLQIRQEKQSAHETLRSPGLLLKHYSPKARLVLRAWPDEAALKEQISALQAPLKSTHVVSHTNIPAGDAFGRVSVIPHDAEAFARAIYGELHQCDEHGAELIVVEALPATEEWRAIRDRLQRGSAEEE